MKRADAFLAYTALALTLAAVYSRVWAPQLWPILAPAALTAAAIFGWRRLGGRHG